MNNCKKIIPAHPNSSQQGGWMREMRSRARRDVPACRLPRGRLSGCPCPDYCRSAPETFLPVQEARCRSLALNQTALEPSPTDLECFPSDQGRSWRRPWTKRTCWRRRTKSVRRKRRRRGSCRHNMRAVACYRSWLLQPKFRASTRRPRPKRREWQATAHIQRPRRLHNLSAAALSNCSSP